MSLLAVLFFIVMPVVELMVAIEVADRIGWLNTLVLLMLISVSGVFVVRHQGIATWRKVRASMADGVVPGPVLLDGALKLLAGVLLILPGFLGAILAVLLLLPPTRSLAAALARRFFVGRIVVREYRFRASGAVDIEGHEPGDRGSGSGRPPEELPPGP